MQAFSSEVFRSPKVSAIFSIVVVLTVFAVAGTFSIGAQGNPAKTPGKKTPASGVCIPPKTAYMSVLQIDSSGKAILITIDGAGLLFDANALSSAGADLRAAINKATVKIKLDPSLKMDVVFKILKGIRSLGGCPNIEASTNTEDPYIYIYPEPKDQGNVAVFPNPLTLVVQLDKNGKLTLNNESKGSVNDTSLLRNALKQIFKDRAENGVFREGTNDIESAVSVKAVGSAKFGDLVKIVDALKEAGASPVGLQIDDVETIPVVLIDAPVPQPPKTRPPKRPAP